MKIATPALLLMTSVVPALADVYPSGNWQRGDGNAQVRIEPCGAAICAINTRIRDTSGGEEVGHRLVMTLKPTAPGKLTGSAFDPQRDKTYAIDIVFNEKTMTTRGCILRVLCKSVSWSRLP
ncbi:MAG: hypothetical protein CFE31_09780 [Rhizobiales bacterium PAR1]|nr:MAG: hypothetical protein CFE31_09780 [Rhizobiales bacterium PAR1]